MMDRKAYTLVIFSLFRTDHAYSSVSLSLAREFVKNNRVIYLQHPYSWKDWFRLFWTSQSRNKALNLLFRQQMYSGLSELPENFTAVSPRITIPINWLPKGPIYRALASINNRIISKSVKKALEDLQVGPYIFFNCYDPYFAATLPRGFQPILHIYQSIDDITQDPYSAKHGTYLEQEAIQSADLALVTSTQLQKNLHPFNPNTFILHNAVDTSIFSKTLEENFEKPSEIRQIHSPIIGFTGNLDPLRIDYLLLKEIALKHADKCLLLVGPINSEKFFETGLHQLKNVVSTGGKRIHELPNYLRFMDVCIIPFLKNTLTKSIYPLKINEYLAAGRPVVSTKFSRDIQSFGDVIYLADDQESFLELLGRAISENSEARIQRRIEVARSNTWESRVETFWKLAEKIEKIRKHEHFEKSIST